jgi:CelD/BcsL family acetyltransferase involved in cellulose biosynthesis
MKKVAVISGRDIGPTLERSWRKLQFANLELSNPIFAPEFTKLVAAVRDDVELAVVSEDGRPVAFLPFQRNPSDHSRALPVGEFLSDFQAMICEPNFMCNPLEIIKNCGLVAYDFTKFLASQRPFTPFHQSRDPSPQMDLSHGYDTYAKERRAAGSNLIGDCNRKTRRIERDIGPLRFVPHSSDPELLQRVLAIKSSQYLRTGARDILAIDWVRAVIEKIHMAQTENFSGMLSLLYAGDQLVAAHFGIRSQTIWHSWFPVYNTEMGKYSPGLILFLKMASHAPSVGLQTIDLDRGRSVYKMRLMSRAIMVAYGSVDCRISHRIAQRARSLRVAIVKSPLAGPARRLVQWARGS